MIQWFSHFSSTKNICRPLPKTSCLRFSTLSPSRPRSTIWSMISYNHISGHIISLKVYYDTIYLLWWPKSGMPTPMLGKMWSNRKLTHCWWKLKNGAATLRQSLVISYRIKYTLTIWSSNCAPWNLPKGVKNICAHKSLHMDVYSSFTHNFQNLEVTKMFFSRWMDK